MSESEPCKKKILVVEDEPVIGRLCQRVFTDEGYDVDVVNNGLSAKEVATNTDYDLCISDIRLPGMTGIQLYEYWETSNNNLTGHLIFMTGDTLSNNIQAFLDKSGKPCLMKPFSPDDLIDAVRKTLE
jgi:CheY-like chemotaxis protein